MGAASARAHPGADVKVDAAAGRYEPVANRSKVAWATRLH
jgi:hypothetical protein